MKQHKYVAPGIIFALVTLSLLILGIVSAEPNAARGGPQGTAAPGASTTAVPQLLSCSNPQQCREIDEVWQRIGTAVRGSSEIWDVSTTKFGWRAFTAVYVPPAPLPSVPTSIPPSPVTAAVLQGCQITTPADSQADSQAVGTLRNGKLINGVKTATTSFNNDAKEAYSYDTRKMEKTEYGTLELIQALELTSCAMQARFGVKLQVKDRSLPNGGPTYKDAAKAAEKPPAEWLDLEPSDRYGYTHHSTHLNGLDADLGYFLKEGTTLTNQLSILGCSKDTCDSTHLPTTKFTDEKALEANWALLKTLNQVFPLDYVAFDKYLIRELHSYACKINPPDPDLAVFFKERPCANIPAAGVDPADFYKGGTLRHLNGHAHHFHIAIKCPQEDRECQGERATRGIIAPTNIIAQQSPASVIIT